MNHSNIALYQASIWTCLDEQQVYLTPSNFGYKMENDRWTPRWTILPEASKAWSEFLKCGCKVGKVVVTIVSGPMYHALNSVVPQEADRTKILRNGATTDNNLRYLSKDVKN